MGCKARKKGKKRTHTHEGTKNALSLALRCLTDFSANIRYTMEGGGGGENRRILDGRLLFSRFASFLFNVGERVIMA